MGADDAPLLHAGVDADARLRRQRQRDEPSRRGAKVGRRVLRIEPRLDGVAAEGDLLLPARQRLARRDAKLPFDEVEPGHRLRHRMLDLEPRIHLDEEEILGLEAACDASAMNSTVPAPS